MSRSTSDNQPGVGELVVHCEHIPHTKDVYTFEAPMMLKFTRQDGSKGESKWLMCCNACYVKANGDPAKLVLPKETVWNNKIVYYKDN